MSTVSFLPLYVTNHALQQSFLLGRELPLRKEVGQCSLCHNGVALFGDENIPKVIYSYILEVFSFTFHFYNINFSKDLGDLRILQDIKKALQLQMPLIDNSQVVSTPNNDSYKSYEHNINSNINVTQSTKDCEKTNNNTR